LRVLLVALGMIALLSTAAAQNYEIINQTYADPFAIDIGGMPDFDTLPVDDPEDGIDWVKVDLPSPCLTGDGNPAFIMVRKGTETDKLLVYLMGGGACASYETCRPSSEGGMVTTLNPDFYSLSVAYTKGIFNTTDERNPFRNWTIVFVPYSTGDIHSGNRVVKYFSSENPSEDKTIYHIGFVNSITAMRWIASQLQPSKIVLAGSSAGGFGTILNSYWANVVFNDSLIVINDAGPGTKSNTTSTFQDQLVGELWGSKQNFPEEWQPNFGNTDILNFVPYFLERCPECVYGLFEDQLDLVIGVVFQMYNPIEFQQKLLTLTNSIKANYSDQFYRYMPVSTYHTVLAGGYIYPAGDRFYNLNIDGYYLYQWVNDLLLNNPQDVVDFGTRDLLVSSIETSTLLENSSSNITVTVKNSGSSLNPDPFMVGLSITDDTQNTTLVKVVKSLQPGEAIKLNFTWTPETSGYFTITATADYVPELYASLLPFGSVVETDEFNNVQSVQKQVLTAEKLQLKQQIIQLIIEYLNNPSGDLKQQIIQLIIQYITS